MADEEKDPRAGGAPEEPAPEAEAAKPEDGEKKDEIPMKVAVEEAGTCRKKLKIEIEASRVDEDIRKGLEEIRTTVPLPGFRKGRVPRTLLSKRFGKRVLEDVRASLVAGAMPKAIDKEKIKPFSMPELSDKDIEAIQVQEGRPLAFEFTVDVRPEVALDQYTELEVERPKVEVSKEETERELESLRLRRGRVVPVEGGEVRVRDSVVVNREFFLGEEKVHSVENVALAVPEEGSRMLERSPWLKEFVGKKQGDVVETPLRLPDDLPAEAARGKDGRQRITLLDIKRLEMPPLNAEFLEEVGAKTEEDLRARIEKEIRAAKESLADRLVEDALLDQLLAKAPMPLPDAVVNREIEGGSRRFEERLKEMKVPAPEIEERMRKYRETRRASVEKEFRTWLLVEEVARKERIFATEDDVEARVGAMAASRGKWPSQMREELGEKGLMDQVREQIREDKVKTFLREKAKVREGRPLDEVIREREKREHEGHEHEGHEHEEHEHEEHDPGEAGGTPAPEEPGAGGEATP
jgi:trigger factor